MCYELTKSKMQKLDLHGINSKRGSYKITSSIKNYISIATFLQSVLKPKRSWSQKTRKWTNTYSKCSLYSCLVVCKYVEAEWSFGIQWITAESRATHWMSSTGQFTPSLPNLSRGNSSGQVVPGKLAESHPSARWKLYRCFHLPSPKQRIFHSLLRAGLRTTHKRSDDLCPIQIAKRLKFISTNLKNFEAKDSILLSRHRASWELFSLESPLLHCNCWKRDHNHHPPA